MDERENAQFVARRILSQRLEALGRAGVQQIGRVPTIFQPAAMPFGTPHATKVDNLSEDRKTLTPALSQREREQSPEPLRPTSIVESTMPRSPSPALPLSLSQPYPGDLTDTVSGRQELLDTLSEEVRACKLCRELACTRKQTVFGVGHAKPRVVFFGEAPGADEDRQGEPFVGRAGQLLTKIIEACGWKRSDVYIMNVLKCRPPDNRNPSPAETDNCRPFFERQLEILRPEYIVCVGTVPAQALLETAESVGKLRGRFHRYRDSTVLVTYHPSYLLRNPSAKKYVWDDMQMLLTKMGLPIPGKA
jgi:DNA polymerase